MSLSNDPGLLPAASGSESPLQPPGTILVLGTDWAGLETALYGRYLGYDVSVWGLRDGDQPALGPTLQNDWWSEHWRGDRSIAEAMTQPPPMLPTRCLSSLAIDALVAQKGDRQPIRWPETMRDWATGTLADLASTDLLAGRVHPHRQIQSVRLVEPVDDQDGNDQDDDDANDSDPVPPDFEVTFCDAPGGASDVQTFEAIIQTTAPRGGVVDLPIQTRYRFEIQSAPRPDDAQALTRDAEALTRDAEAMMRDVQQQIVAIYATLADRANLDLYLRTRH